MIDTDKYEGHNLSKGRVGSDYNIYDRKGNIIFDADDVGSNMATLNLLADAPLLLAEVKRLRERVKTEKNLKLWEKAEVKRLREENERYLDFIFWLGIEHKGKELAWEYGDEKIVEML